MLHGFFCGRLPETLLTLDHWFCGLKCSLSLMRVSLVGVELGRTFQASVGNRSSRRQAAQCHSGHKKSAAELPRITESSAPKTVIDTSTLGKKPACSVHCMNGATLCGAQGFSRKARGSSVCVIGSVLASRDQVSLCLARPRSTRPS